MDFLSVGSTDCLDPDRTQKYVSKALKLPQGGKTGQATNPKIIAGYPYMFELGHTCADKPGTKQLIQRLIDTFK